MNQNLRKNIKMTENKQNSGNSFRPFPGYKTACTALILLCLVITSAITGIRPAAAENVTVNTWEALANALRTDGNNITLGDEIRPDDPSAITDDSQRLIVPSGVTVILDLNGKTIDRGLAEAEAVKDGYVIRIGAGTLILMDTIKTGNITGGNSSGRGGGVYVDEGGSFILKGGTISGNKARNSGGGVVVDGSFTMESGTISGNTAYTGGGVDVRYNRLFNMTGGMISGNTSQWGCGVYSDGTFSMSGGMITENIMNIKSGGERGAGVYSGGTFNISGNPVITGNKKELSGGFFEDENVWLAGRDSIITVTGPLTNTIPIGVRTDGGIRTFTSGLSGKGKTVNFRSDDYYAVGIEGSEACLKNETADRIIIFDSNGETGGTNFQSGGLNTEVTLNENSFTGSLPFCGWNTLPDGTGAYYRDGGKIILSGDVTLYAQWGNAAEIVGGEEYLTLQDAVNAAANDDTVRLLTHIDRPALAGGWPLQIGDGTNSREVILDLNGFAIDRGLKIPEAAEDGYVILVGNGGDLTLRDSSTAETGIITGGYNEYYGGGVYVDSGGTFTMEGGTISGNTSIMGFVGGVYVDSGGAFTMKGGTISGNTSSYSSGGGVYVSEMSVSGEVGTFTMSGGTIIGNTSYNGGGVFVDAGGAFTMTGGAIRGNTSYIGGGVYAAGTFTISGGAIIGNTAEEQGGGVYGEYVDTENVMSVSGTPLISRNVLSGGTENNVFLENQRKISVTGALSDAAVGITMESPGVFTSGLSDRGTAANFSSDDDRYAVRVNNNGEAELYHAVYNVTVTISGHGTVTASTESTYRNTPVILTVSPSSGYILSPDGLTVSYTDGSGVHTVRVKAGSGVDPLTGAGEWSFTMPAADVTVSGEFFTPPGWLQSKLNNAASGSVITLDRDIIWTEGDPAPLTFARSGVELTLDLNGFKIDRGLTEAAYSGYVIEVSGSLTLKDSSSAKTGKITGGYNNLIGGGVVINGGSFILESGTVSGCTAAYGGAGVYVNSGTFTMTGGRIFGNRTTGSQGQGGGVFVKDSFILESGTISGNSASNGGGVYAGSESELTLSGGTISGNTALFNGGGVYSSGTAVIRNAPTVSGNVWNGTYDEEEGVYTGGTVNNIYLYSGKCITVTGGLTGEAGSIGINMQRPGVFTDTAQGNLSLNDASKFFSDDPGYTAGKNADGQLYLGIPVYISGISAADKTYDGTTAASLAGTAVLNRVRDDTQVSGLTVSGITAVFADKNAGNGKNVSVIGALLSETAGFMLDLDKTNEKLGLTASITARPVTVSGVTAVPRAYEAGDLTTALTGGEVIGKVDGDDVSADMSAAAGTMADADIGTDKPVTVSGVMLGGADAGNYVLSAQPSGVTVTISGDGTAPSGNAALRLPSGLKELQASAFEGSPSFDEVYLPDGMETIGSRAFADCSGLKLVHIPDSVTSIADDAFAGSLHVIFSCTSDSHGADYARDHYIMRQNP